MAVAEGIVRGVSCPEVLPTVSSTAAASGGLLALAASTVSFFPDPDDDDEDNVSTGPEVLGTRRNS